MEMDTWSQMFAEKFNNLFKVCVHTGRSQSNVGRCGQTGGESKITENMWTSFMDDPLYRNHYCFQNLLLNQHGKQHPLEEKRLRKITVSNMEVFRKNFKMKGISVNVGELKFDARTDDPAANYELPWGQWANWSSKAKIDPF